MIEKMKLEILNASIYLNSKLNSINKLNKTNLDNGIYSLEYCNMLDILSLKMELGSEYGGDISEDLQNAVSFINDKDDLVYIVWK